MVASPVVDTATATVDPSPDAAPRCERPDVVAPVPYVLAADVQNPVAAPMSPVDIPIAVLPLPRVDVPPVPPPAAPSADALWSAIGRQVAEQRSTTRGMGLAIRVGALIVGFILALRLVYDDVLPRLLLLLSVAGAIVLVVAMSLRAVAEARRQRVLLVALAHLTRLCRVDPSLRVQFAPQIEGVMAALRAEPRVWPWTQDAGPLATLLARYVPSDRAALPDPPSSGTKARDDA